MLARDTVDHDANLIYGAEVVDHRLCAILQFTTTANRSRSSEKRGKSEEGKSCWLLINERDRDREPTQLPISSPLFLFSFHFFSLLHEQLAPRVCRSRASSSSIRQRIPLYWLLVLCSALLFLFWLCVCLFQKPFYEISFSHPLFPFAHCNK